MADANFTSLAVNISKARNTNQRSKRIERAEQARICYIQTQNENGKAKMNQKKKVVTMNNWMEQTLCCRIDCLVLVYLYFA